MWVSMDPALNSTSERDVDREAVTSFSTRNAFPDNDECVNAVNDIRESSTHFQELTKMEDLSRLLKEMKQRLNEASMRCHLLNVDIVTQFNPLQVEELKRTKLECSQCIERMTENDKGLNERLQPTRSS